MTEDSGENHDDSNRNENPVAIVIFNTRSAARSSSFACARILVPRRGGELQRSEGWMIAYNNWGSLARDCTGISVIVVDGSRR